MRTTTNVNPLIVNYMTPETPKVVSEESVAILYDLKEQITYVMGGGNGKSRSYDGYQETTKRGSGTTIVRGNDAPRWTDD